MVQTNGLIQLATQNLFDALTWRQREIADGRVVFHESAEMREDNDEQVVARRKGEGSEDARASKRRCLPWKQSRSQGQAVVEELMTRSFALAQAEYSDSLDDLATAVS